MENWLDDAARSTSCRPSDLVSPPYPQRSITHKNMKFFSKLDPIMNKTDNQMQNSTVLDSKSAENIANR